MSQKLAMQSPPSTCFCGHDQLSHPVTFGGVVNNNVNADTYQVTITGSLVSINGTGGTVAALTASLVAAINAAGLQYLAIQDPVTTANFYIYNTSGNRVGSFTVVLGGTGSMSTLFSSTQANLCLLCRNQHAFNSDTNAASTYR